MRMAFVLLRCIGKAVVKNVVNLFTYGVGGDILVDSWDYWCEASQEEKRAADVQALAAASPAEVAAAAAEVVQQEGARLSESERQAVTEYLKQVPAMIRRSQRRPADPEGKTVRPGATFGKPDDLLPLLPPQAPRFKPGDRPLPGVDWELVELLGRGGFGEVWKAKNPHFDGVAPVALKFCLDPAVKERLLKHEAAVLNQVMRQGRHDGIVPLLHSYLSADPPCLAYEYVAGGDLTGLIQDTARCGGMAPDMAARYVLNLATIVGFAHGLNPPIVHRDLKPANILVQVRPDGKAALKIADFGIGGVAVQQAREASRRPTAAAFFTSAVLGSYTLLYASPQQMRGEPPHPSDDVYALGVIWHQLLTGDVTKGCPTGRGWQKRLTDRGMSQAMVDVLIDCFGDEREERPANAAVLAKRLTALLGGAVPSPPRPKPAQPPAEGDLAAVFQRSMQAVNSAHADARRMMEQDHDYVAAVKILEAVPEHLRDGKLLETARKLLETARQRVARVAHLDKTVRELVQATRTEGLREAATELLQLCPERTELRRLLDTLPKGPEKQIINSIGMKLTLIPAGHFLMGEGGSQRAVTISRPFYLGIYPVTQREYKAVTGVNPSGFKGGLFKKTAAHPVEQVSWIDAIEFCRRLSSLPEEKQAGRIYDLPTEAEWEYAYRAGTTTAHFFGDSDSQLGDYAWFDGNSGNQTQPVGRKKSNPWGLYDMAGNVCEWCKDWYADNPDKNDNKDPHGPQSGESRVLRGGSWSFDAMLCRAAFRLMWAPGKCWIIYGFRVCVRLD